MTHAWSALRAVAPRGRRPARHASCAQVVEQLVEVLAERIHRLALRRSRGSPSVMMGRTDIAGEVYGPLDWTSDCGRAAPGSPQRSEGRVVLRYVAGGLGRVSRSGQCRRCCPCYRSMPALARWPPTCSRISAAHRGIARRACCSRRLSPAGLLAIGAPCPRRSRPARPPWPRTRARSARLLGEVLDDHLDLLEHLARPRARVRGGRLRCCRHPCRRPRRMAPM